MNLVRQRCVLPFMRGLIWGLVFLFIPGLAVAQVTLPARIQAEDYDNQSGVSTTTTSDIDGGDDIYCLWIGDWASYNVYVPSTGDYTITIRANSDSGAGNYFRIEIDDEDVTGTIGPDGGGYRDVVVEDVSLTAGNCVLKYYQVNGWSWDSSINWIEVTAPNAAPSVDAGLDDIVTYSSNATLDATVTDDGLPSSPGTYTVLWTKQSGPGTVTFGDDDAVDTTAAFSASGTYVLRLTADDSEETGYDEVTIEANAAPTVDAGLDDIVTYSSSATLDATVSDDGLPASPATYTVTWTKTSGPGTVTFGNSSAVDTTAAFSVSGTYVMRLTAGDGDATTYDELTIESNAAPSVNAGLDDSILVTSSASLDATVSDDGLPSAPGTYTVTWTRQSGPGTVTFGSTSSVDTTVTFDTVGTYVLRLTVDDDDTTAYDEVEITVSTGTGWSLTIQAEDYDDQSGAATTTTGDVDGGDDLYCMWIGDWTEYNINIPSSADCDITVRVYTDSGAGNYFRIEIDDEDVTGTIGPDTSGVYVDVVAEDVALTSGNHTMKYYQVNGWGWDSCINWIKIESEGGTSNTAPTVDAGIDQTVSISVGATLDATVSDDGLPSSPGSVTTTWTKQSGPGTVTFGDSSAVDTTAAFSASGTYVLRLTADDGEETAYDEVTITANATPIVDAGTDQSISITSSATLDATVTDDGLPASYTVLWTKDSGTGDVTFVNASAEDTTAAFSTTGTYVLKLTADDGDAQSYDTVSITVTSANTAPIVNAGLDDVIYLSGEATLDATVSDDGLPASPGTYTVIWTKQSGPGTATFGNATVADTTVVFDTSGTYILRLTADDSLAQTYDELTIEVLASGTVILPAKIEMEDYRSGGQNVGYYDVSEDNYGGQYRSDDVDICSCTDTGGGYAVAWIVEDEWLAYDVYVPATSKYTFTFRTHSNEKVFHVELDDEDVSGSLMTYTAGGYDDTVAEDITLDVGVHVLKVVFDATWGYDDPFNYMDIAGTTPPEVDAGYDQSITFPATSVTLDTTVTDDGLPDPPGEVNLRWTISSGPENGYVDFSDKYAADVTVTFDTTGVYVLRLTADDSESTGYDEVQITVNESSSRVSLPGRLEAEDYSDQGEGIGYHDTTSGNTGSTYRSDDVDIESCSDTGGGYDVSWIVADEWLAFAVSISEAKSYDIIARVNSSTSSRQMHVEVDDVDVTGAMTFDSTGGWTDVTAEGIHLTAGPHVVKIVMDTGDFDLNYVDVLGETYEEYIVENNTANADIVISSSPFRTVSLAADELQDIIYDISGATLPIVTTPTSADVHIYVGESSYTSALGISTTGMEHDSYKIVTGSNWMALVGADTDYTPIYPYGGGSTVQDDWDDMNDPYLWLLPYESRSNAHDGELDIWNSDGKGSLNAVYAFLYDLGCRWYFPGSAYEIAPDLDDIGLPAENRTVEPDFTLREWFQYYTEFDRPNNADEVRWQLRMGLNDGRESIGLGPRGHGIAYVIGRDEYATSHPEYYALYDGERSSGSGQWSKPCLSATGLLAENVAYVETLFDHYNEPMVNVSPSDGYYNLCECAYCEGKGTYERGTTGRLSDYVFAYVDELADEVYTTYPDRKVNCLAYASYYLPPLDIETMSPNLVITFCRWRSWFEDPDMKLLYQDGMHDWMEKLPSDQFFIWDYYLHARPPVNDYTGIPVYFPWLIRDDLRNLAELSMGDYIEVQRNWPDWELSYHALAANHLNLYITARLYWNSDEDVNTMLDEYYEKFYGDAADEMRTFVEYCEANWLQAAINIDSDDFTLIAQMRTRLNTAISAATGVYADRVDLLNDFLAEAEAREE